jgi:hypothetical protein
MTRGQEIGKAEYLAFDGDFDLLPLKAHILFGAVPTHPTYEDFALAVTEVFGNRFEPAAHWRVEAIRARRLQPGVKLDDVRVEINRATAKRLYEVATEAE